MQEEGRRIPGEAAPFGGRIDHPVRRRRQNVVGQPLQHVADIDHQSPRRRRDVQPFAIRVLQLQPGLLGPQQKRDDVDVLMRPGAHARRIGRYRRIVQHPQHRVAQLDLVLEIVVAEVHVAGDGLQDLASQGVQRLEHAVEVVAEPRHLGWPQIGAHVAAIGVTGGQFAARVPELLQIDRLGVPGGLGAERRQAPRAPGARLVIGTLDVFGQGEEGLGVRDRSLDDRLVQTVVRYDGEPVARERGPEVVAEALEVGVVTRHRYGGDALA